MTPQIEIHGLYRDGWSLFVPAALTCAFIQFLRKHKLAATIDISVVPKGSFGLPELDCFVLDGNHTQEKIDELKREFAASQGK